MKKTNILLLGMLLLSACNNTSSSLSSSNNGENINNNDPSFIYEKTSDKEITLDIEERETIGRFKYIEEENIDAAYEGLLESIKAALQNLVSEEERDDD